MALNIQRSMKCHALIPRIPLDLQGLLCDFVTVGGLPERLLEHVNELATGGSMTYDADGMTTFRSTRPLGYFDTSECPHEDTRRWYVADGALQVERFTDEAEAELICFGTPVSPYLPLANLADRNILKHIGKKRARESRAWNRETLSRLKKLSAAERKAAKAENARLKQAQMYYVLRRQAQHQALNP